MYGCKWMENDGWNLNLFFSFILANRKTKHSCDFQIYTNIMISSIFLVISLEQYSPLLHFVDCFLSAKFNFNVAQHYKSKRDTACTWQELNERKHITQIILGVRLHGRGWGTKMLQAHQTPKGISKNDTVDACKQPLVVKRKIRDHILYYHSIRL